MTRITPSLMGLETELALSATSRRERDEEPRSLVDRLARTLFRRVKEEAPSLPGADGNRLYLGNGSCFYIDAGSHPELCTPECRSPSELVRYVLAGEKLLERCLPALEEAHGGPVLLGKSNVDYHSGKTWGCHESYLHRVHPKRLAKELMPHLVSRQVYTGAGGFDSRSWGLVFLLSPRVPHLFRDVSSHSTEARGIFHTKNEPLCGGGYRRLHLICGESLCSQTSMWLRAATTALLLAVIETGAPVARGIEPTEALPAMRAYAQDPELGVGIPVQDRRTNRSALDIQWRLLERVESRIDRDGMPPWGKEACVLWRRTLDELEESPERAIGRLDWPTKRALYGRRLATHDLDWDDVRALNEALGLARRARAEEGPRRPGPAPSGELLRGLSREARLTIESPLKDRDLHASDLERFPAVRAELMELDVRFSQLQSGIFAGLEQAGLLDHRAPGVDAIEEAIEHPPQGSRARLRGEAITQLSPKRESRYSTWDRIHDFQRNEFLDLSDPFATQAQWRAIEAEDRIASQSHRMAVRETLEMLAALHQEPEPDTDER